MYTVCVSLCVCALDMFVLVYCRCVWYVAHVAFLSVCLETWELIIVEFASLWVALCRQTPLFSVSCIVQCMMLWYRNMINVHNIQV